MIRVNRSHPLSRGLLAWAMPLPGAAGTAMLLDVLSRRRYGFVASYLGGSPSYAAGENQFPGPAVRFPPFDSVPTHTAGRVDLGGNLASLGVGSALTVSIRAYTPNSSTLECFCGEAENPPDADVGTIFRLSDNTYWGRVTNSSGTPATVNAGTWPTARWTTATLTYDGATVTLYADGDSLGTASLSGSVYPTATGYAIGTRGSQDADYARFGNTGMVASWQLWNRALSASEVALQWAETRAGFPGMLIRDRAPLRSNQPGRFRRLGVEGGFPAYAGGF